MSNPLQYVNAFGSAATRTISVKNTWRGEGRKKWGQHYILTFVLFNIALNVAVNDCWEGWIRDDREKHKDHVSSGKKHRVGKGGGNFRTRLDRCFLGFSPGLFNVFSSKRFTRRYWKNPSGVLALLVLRPGCETIRLKEDNLILQGV